MARYRFGGGIADYVVKRGDGEELLLAANAPVTFWSAATAGQQYLDLLDETATPIPGGIVTADDNGAIPVISQGPEGARAMWASASSDGSAPRRLILASDVDGQLDGLDMRLAALEEKLLGVGRLSAGALEPVTPQDGDVWFDTSAGDSTGPVAFRTSSSIFNPGSTAGTTCPLPGGVQPGDMMLLAMSADVGGGDYLKTPPPGWTPLATPGGIGQGDTLAGYWYRVYEAGDESPLATLSNPRLCTMVIAVYGGAATSPDAIGTPGTRAGRTNITTAPSITTTVDDCVVVGLFLEKGTTTATVTDPPGTVRRHFELSQGTAKAPSILVVDFPQAAAGSTGDKSAAYFDGSGAVSDPDNGSGLLVALKRR